MTADLPSRIAAAVGHGLWYAQSDPDSVQPEATKAVLAVVQPIAADRDRLAGELEEAAHRTNVQRTRAEQAEAERDRLSALAAAQQRVIERMAREALHADGAGERVREWLDGWGPRLPDGACHTLDQALNHGPVRRRNGPAMVTDHTFEGQPGHGQHCETERFGQTCGAPWEQHQLRDCQHPDTWFDRTICPEPCGAMHDRCTNCGETVNPCALDARTTVDNPLTSTNTVDNPKEKS